ncbi:IS30 family transposase [Kribbella pittospori]|uniref:IS30 family transposase n=1 Tax=Kribbella pittospori TaxID=722689 RepID=UPI00192DC0CD|nr:IS30 family transposase [Kribbella pittospori]
MSRDHLPAWSQAAAAISRGAAPSFAAAHRPGSAARAPEDRASPSPLRAAHAPIHQRPFAPQDRSEAGHWEGDLVIGMEQASAIGTLVERTTRTIRLLRLPRRNSDHLHAALKDRMGDLPPALLRSITWDQGTEMARHTTIAVPLVCDLFCDSPLPRQRGSNENTNGPALLTSLPMP